MQSYLRISIGVVLFALCHGVGAQTFQANNTSGCTPMGVVITVTSPAAGSISSYAWQITTPTGAVLTSSSTQYIAILTQPGTYDVTLTINGNQITTVNDYISVHSLPTANFVSSDQAGCFPLCVDFSDISIQGDGDIVEWSWDFGDGGSSTQQDPSYCYNQVGTFTPVFSVEDENGCFADITMPGLIQVVNNFPVAEFSLSTQLDCNPPVDIGMTNTSTGTSALTSTWDFGDGDATTINGTTAINHDFSTTGIFDVCLTVTDAIGCEDQVCHQLEVFGTANAQYTVSETTGCEGEVFTFTSTTIPTPPVVEWDFDGDGTVDSNNPAASFSFTDAGIFQPELSVSYSSGCSDQNNNTSITITEGTDVAFIGDTLQSCSFPFAVHFTNQSTGPGLIEYEWLVNDVVEGTGLDFDFIFDDYGVYDIALRATNATGCINELLMPAYVLVQEPEVIFDNGVSVCTDQNVPVFDVQVISVDPVEFYFWDFNSDGTTDAEGLAPTFMYSSPGIFTITLTIQTYSGCTATYTNTQTINVLTQVSAEFTASADTTCAGQPVEFCVSYQPGNTFSWNFFDGSGWVIMPLDASCISHEYADTGWYDLTLTVFNGACNVLQTFENFIYVEPPVALFEYQVVCGDMSAEFVDISIGADSIVWDFGDGSPPLINESNPTHTFPANGTYTVLLTAFADGSDCPDTQSVIIVVSAPNANLSFTPNNGCPPLEVGIHCDVFNPHWDVTFSSGDHITVNWNDNAGYWLVTHTWDGGAQNFGFSNPDYFYWPEVIIEDGGPVDVSVTTTDANGCSVDYFYDDVISVSANPDFASFNTTTIDACTSVNLGFQPDLQDLVSWQWVFSDGSVSNSETPFHTFNPPYNYNQPLSATLTATDTLGCTSSVTQTLNVVLPPQVDFIAASDPSCIGDVVQFINYSTGPAGTTYTWDFGDPSSPDNTSTLEEPTHAFDANGDYEVCLYADNQAGCIRSVCDAEAVHIINPEVSFTYNSSINNCLYGVQFTNTTPGTIVNSAWDFGDGQSGFGMMAYHTYPIGVYDVSLTVANGFGCISEITVPDILNYGNQVGPFTQILDTAMCAPFDASFAAFNPADTYFDYFWDFNDGSGDPSGNTSTSHTYTEPGTYCPSIIMTDPNGCPVLISCNEPIEVEEFLLSYSVPEYICYGDTVTVVIENASEYSWDDMTEISSGMEPNSFLLHPQDDTDFILTGYYADCIRIDTINLEVKDLPIVTLNESAYVCHQSDSFVLESGSPSEPPGTYYINGTEESSFDPSWLPGLYYDIEYVYTDSFLCVNSAAGQIFIQPLPVVVFADLGNVCEDVDSIPLNSAIPAGGTYILLGDTITTFYPGIGTGSFEIDYAYSDQFGCVSSDSSHVDVRPLPEPAISFADVCQDVGLIITNNTTIESGTIAQTSWVFGTNTSSNLFQPLPILFPTIGNQNIHMTATSDYNCVASLDTSVVVHAVPVVAFTPDEACQNTPQLFSDASFIAADSLVNWTWNVEGNTFVADDSLVYAFNSWGEIPVMLTVTSDFGCDDSLELSVVVHPAPVVNMQFENGCFGIENHFSSQSSIPMGGIIQEEWSFGDGHPNEFGHTADNLYESTGTYPLSFTATSDLGCQTTVSDSLHVYPIPEVDFALESSTTCEENEVQFFDLSSVDNPSHVVAWQWLIENVPLSADQNATIVFDTPGAFDVTLAVVSNHGCSSDSTLNNGIVVYPKPDAGFTCEDAVSIANPVLNITNTSSEDVTSWYYDFGDETFENFNEGEHTYADYGAYLISQSVWNTFGCRATMSKLILVQPELIMFVPTAFTPDLNTHNDVFFPVITGFDITYYEFKIFDRWGIQVYSTTEPGKGWNGMFNGGPAQDGAYTWSIDIRTATDVTIHHHYGSVILLR